MQKAVENLHALNIDSNNIKGKVHVDIWQMTIIIDIY